MARKREIPIYNLNGNFKHNHRKIFYFTHNDDFLSIKNGGGYHCKTLPNGGFLELCWEKEKISRFLRAMQSDKKKPLLRLLNQELEVCLYEINEAKLSLKLSQNINLEITKE